MKDDARQSAPLLIIRKASGGRRGMLQHRRGGHRCTTTRVVDILAPPVGLSRARLRGAKRLLRIASPAAAGLGDHQPPAGTAQRRLDARSASAPGSTDGAHADPRLLGTRASGSDGHRAGGNLVVHDLWTTIRTGWATGAGPACAGCSHQPRPPLKAHRVYLKRRQGGGSGMFPNVSPICCGCLGSAYPSKSLGDPRERPSSRDTHAAALWRRRMNSSG